MKKEFYIIMAAQALSSLADNALFIAVISLIIELNGPAWVIPLMKWSFALSYVVLAPFVGIISDKFPKGHVMFYSNLIKMLGCLLIIFIPTLDFDLDVKIYLVSLSYSLVGIGAAIYSPAKYGIVTEILPPKMLVQGNSWIEGLTVLSIIIGTCLGGYLITPNTSSFLINQTYLSYFTSSSSEMAVFVILHIYISASIFNLMIKKTNITYTIQHKNTIEIFRNFYKSILVIYKDELGRVSLFVTTVFWGASASLQLIVIKWGQIHLGYSIDQTSILIGSVAIGTIIGATAVAKYLRLSQALSTIPIGITMGLLMLLMPFIQTEINAYLLLIITGVLAGFFVVPMNALLQHRGYKLLSAGHSIAVQNFNEQLNILVMISFYTMLVWFNVDIDNIIIIYGMIVSISMSYCLLYIHINKKLYRKLLAILDKEEQN
ncbi:lysophospholipid transporter LplT [Candidatus Kinetoplastidibacterium crithidiae]|uniref:Lysophospholipid transporter LplT n=1 Tax=Candidatus Kinetoplastidibacterium crithidiae TCC036E TaxID=1208918 RepID=M1LQ95_9PROT|nr:lysophospholipid transporter LplT [Candidatus Kinetoplastibacterium crithidii]AGF47767.1 lysophospholipid transporter LplT [Candidatus Kinetoplastibacterium crithidii TCC036E]